MSIRKRHALVVILAIVAAGCSRTPSATGAKKIKAGQEYSGFLKDYSKLAANPKLEGNVKTFVQTDAQKNLHRYIAVIVDPVEVYLASDADESRLPENTRAAVANYFRAALIKAVSDAFPPVDEPGPLVLRLRSAIIGVDAGGGVEAGDQGSVNVTKVGVEMELLDSETGEQIAAAVDREPLGAGAEGGSANMSRQEKSAAARAAFDEWADRLRIFLNRAHELTGQDALRADQSYRPYGEPPGGK